MFERLPEGKLVGGLEHVLFFHILGMSSSQLTNSNLFQRGFSSTTNQFVDGGSLVNLLQRMQTLLTGDSGSHHADVEGLRLCALSSLGSDGIRWP